MTAKIIFLIAMVFFTVSSGCISLGGERNSRTVQPDKQKSTPTIVAHTNSSTEATITPNSTQDTVKKWPSMCCLGDRNENGTGTSDCPSYCKHGKYDETLYCTILVNDSETQSIIRQCPDSGKNHSATETFFQTWEKFRKCSSECLNHLNNTLDTCIIQSPNETYHLLPIDSPCNALAPHWAFLIEWRYPIGGAVGILIVTIVICVVCIVKRKPRTRGPTEDIPLANTKCPDYMEDNVIYS